MKTLNDWILLDRHEAAPTPLLPAFKARSSWIS